MLTYPVIISQYCHPCYTFRFIIFEDENLLQTIFVLYLFSDKYINIISREKSLSCWLENIFYLSFLVIELEGGWIWQIFTQWKMTIYFLSYNRWESRKTLIRRSTVFIQLFRCWNIYFHVIEERIYNIKGVTYDRIWSATGYGCPFLYLKYYFLQLVLLGYFSHTKKND